MCFEFSRKASDYFVKFLKEFLYYKINICNFMLGNYNENPCIHLLYRKLKSENILLRNYFLFVLYD